MNWERKLEVTVERNHRYEYLKRLVSWKIIAIVFARFLKNLFINFTFYHMNFLSEVDKKSE